MIYWSFDSSMLSNVLQDTYQSEPQFPLLYQGTMTLSLKSTLNSVD